MPAQYSDWSAPLLAVDSASPRTSVAVGAGGRVLAAREGVSGRSSPGLLRQIDEALEEAGTRLDQLAGLIGILGPGSFTGLRVGLATLLGIHRSLGLPATGISTFAALAWQARGPRPLLAAVDALRGQWFTQLWSAGDRPQPLEEPVLRSPAEIAAMAPDRVVGFGLDALAAAGPALRLTAARPLAPELLEWAAATEVEWQPLLLTEPLYLRPPATTPPPGKVKPPA